MRIFIPTDLNEESIDALENWISEFDAHNADISLIHVIEPSRGHGAIMIDIAQVLRSEAVKKMEELIKKFDFKKGKLDYKIENGYYTNKMQEMVQIYNPDFILMASKAKTGFDKIFEGQKAKKFVGNMPCPVMIIPNNCANFNFQRFGLAINESDKPNEKTNEFLKVLEKYFVAKIVSFHIDAEENSDLSYYESLSNSGNYGHVTVLKSPSITEGINRFKMQENLDALILLTHKKGFISELMGENVSKKLIEENEIPLLIINQA